MQEIALIIHVLLAIAIVALVLLQHGKGADVGAAFGAGASNTMFGSQGSKSFLFKLTAILAALFFLSSLFLSFVVNRMEKSQSALNIPAASATAQVAPQKAAPMTLTIKKPTKKTTTHPTTK